MSYFPSLKDISRARLTIREVVNPTPLTENLNLSERYGAEILLKREDLQVVRSYKIRGAFNKIKSLTANQLKKGIVCASAGNHAQGVAYSCQKLGIKGTIFMPATTPKQKVEQVKMFGRGFTEIQLIGDTYDASCCEAKKYCHESGKTFIHPFDDPKIIEGQATIGIEILEGCPRHIDYLIIPVGGGGLAAGVGAYFKQMSPDTKIIGVEPAGAQSMRASFNSGKVEQLDSIDRFIDGAAVKRVGDITYPVCKEVLDEIIAVPEGAVCTTILQLYNQNAIVAEPAGALSIAALEFCKEQIKGKTVVCIVSGSNNDITRTEEIRERSLLYEGLKHYFIIRFPQRSGALLSFIRDVMGPNDDITHFAYSKKTNRDQGPALIGIELANSNDFNALINRMNEQKIVYEYINQREDLFGILI
jgi:threonine dehydratase